MNSNIAYYQQEKISKLPHVIESVENLDFNNNIGKNVSDILGLDIPTEGKMPRYNLKKTDNALDYAKQFEENYKCSLSMLTNDIFRHGIKTNTFNANIFVTEDVQKNLVENVFSSMYLKAVNKKIGDMEKTGRVNKTAGTWILWGLVAALTGAIVGGIALAGAKSKMETVRSAFDAHQYLDGNKNVERFSDTLLDESTTKKKIVHQSYSSDSRSSGSSSSRSTYRSHSSGSSGRSHTSSTRNF